MAERIKRYFKAYYYVSGWYPINFGLNIDFGSPNIDIHIPFGFIRIGWDTTPRGKWISDKWKDYKFIHRSFGLY
ncbi:hypothetical protein LCGC14_1078530 [marine sediment metagenome]|uniref:Uncharacterized protein n=1 Tax=marine sediment metagenome TaxID=412755 RepID=A0A0F9MKT5_9ZZZZ